MSHPADRSQDTRKEKYRVLVVEDHAPARTALVRLLGHAGFHVEGAGTMAEAKKKLSWQPQAVLLDAFLPDGCGIELVPAIREAVPDVMLALVTGAMFDPGALGQLQRLNPEAIFLKPVRPEELLSWVERSYQAQAESGEATVSPA